MTRFSSDVFYFAFTSSIDNFSEVKDMMNLIQWFPNLPVQNHLGGFLLCFEHLHLSHTHEHPDLAGLGRDAGLCVYRGFTGGWVVAGVWNYNFRQ